MYMYYAIAFKDDYFINVIKRDFRLISSKIEKM